MTTEAGSELPQFSREVTDTVGLFMPDVRDAADCGGPLSKQSDCGQCLNRIADGVHIDVDSAQRSANDCDAISVSPNFATHFFQALDERHIALQAIGR